MDSRLRARGMGWPNGAADNATILALPSPYLLMLAPEARYHHAAAVQAEKTVLWRAIPRVGKRPAELGWSVARALREVLNLTDETTAPIADFVPFNELDLRDERGDQADDWQGLDERYALLGGFLFSVLSGLKDRLPGARVHFPAWTPDHCLVPDQRVTARGTTEASMRYYEGDVVRIQTATGNQVTATPNHPILTRQGWLPASQINEGMEVAQHSFVNASPSKSNDVDMPTPISEVFRSLNQRGAAATFPSSAHHFHGDGRGSDVYVVATNRQLRRSLAKSSQQFRLMVPPVRNAALSLCRPPFQSLLKGQRVRPGIAFAPSLDRFDKFWSDPGQAITPLRGLEVGPERFGLGSGRPPSLLESNENITRGAPKGFADLSRSFASQITFVHVRHVERGIPFHGYVYNLSTQDRLIIADDIVTHNCALDHLACWRPAAEAADVVDFHAYDSLAAIEAQYRQYRRAFPTKPLWLSEWHCKGDVEEERRVLVWLARTMARDPLFETACFFIWRWDSAPGWWSNAYDVEHNPARLALFQNPPGAEEPPMSNREQYEPIARAAAERHGVDQELFVRQITQESGWNPAALSPAGAAGIAQIVPRFHPGVNVWDPESSLEYAAGLMRDHLAYWRAQGASHPTDYARALASYNAGRQATIDGLAGRKPGWPFGETVRYVAAILQLPAGEAAQLLTAQPAAGPEPIKLSEVLARGRARLGDPYVWDGEQPGGFDCSGFVRYCYRGRLTSFTDAILGETARVEQPAPGDVVLYEYADPSQPGVRFPHCGLYLDDGRVLDARHPDGVGERAQLPRTQARRYYRRAPNVEVDTLAPPPPPPPPVDELAALAAENARLRTALGYLAVDVADALAKEVETIKASLGALEAAISTQRSHKP